MNRWRGTYRQTDRDKYWQGVTGRLRDTERETERERERKIFIQDLNK